MAGQDAPATLPTANPLLTLRARRMLLPEPAVNAAGMLLRPLFGGRSSRPCLASVAAVDYWLFTVHGLGGGCGRFCATRLIC